jgi:hypothetical protein
MRRRTASRLLCFVFLIGACATGGQQAAPLTGSGMSVKVASFDLLASQPQRLQVGLVDDHNQLVLSGGTVSLALRPLDRGTGSSTERAIVIAAKFVPLAGQTTRAPDQPTFMASSSGVYRTDPLILTDAGFWQVDVTAATMTGTKRATASFEVQATSVLPRPGDRAPDTDNPLPGATGVSLAAIDSRADEQATAVPDPELHSITIAGALRARRPLIVVISTPTFCESRLCGPITESVAALARANRTDLAFVHLEVWRDYNASELNPAAQQWIDPKRTHEGNEPWVFVVNRNGIIVDRFDNVASDDDLLDAAARIAS